MKIILVGQSSSNKSNNVQYKNMSYAPYALKAYLDTYSHYPIEAKVIDFDNDAGPEEMTDVISLEQPDIITFSVYIWNYPSMLECARKTKDRSPGMIIFGGPQVSPMADELMESAPFIDIIASAHSDGETILLNIVNTLCAGNDLANVGGIKYRQNEVVKSGIGEIVSIDYNKTPSPYPVNDFNADHTAVIETSRGCPFDCGYCFWNGENRRIKYFPIERVLHDVECVYNNPRIKHVYFADANFCSDIIRAEIILKHIISQKSNAVSLFEINFLSVTESTAKLLTQLPQFEFLLAIQTTNANALNMIGKFRPGPEKYRKKIQEVRSWVPGAHFRVDLMLGLPGDDLEGYIETLNFALLLELDNITINYPVYLLPGTKFYANRSAWGLKSSINAPHAIIETPTFPKADIEKAFRLSIWLQIFINYYPDLARLFYRLARLDSKRIERIIAWSDAINAKIDLFAGHEHIVDIAVRSVMDCNRIKKRLLRMAMTPDFGRAIYHTVSSIEGEGFLNIDEIVNCFKEDKGDPRGDDVPKVWGEP